MKLEEIADIQHHVNNPLAIIVGYCKLNMTDEQFKVIWHEVQRISKHLERIQKEVEKK